MFYILRKCLPLAICSPNHPPKIQVDEEHKNRHTVSVFVVQFTKRKKFIHLMIYITLHGYDLHCFYVILFTRSQCGNVIFPLYTERLKYIYSLTLLNQLLLQPAAVFGKQYFFFKGCALQLMYQFIEDNNHKTHNQTTSCPVETSCCFKKLLEIKKSHNSQKVVCEKCNEI